MPDRERYIRRQLYLPSYQVEAINAYAKKTGVTASEHYRRAVDLYMRVTKIHPEESK